MFQRSVAITALIVAALLVSTVFAKSSFSSRSSSYSSSRSSSSSSGPKFSSGSSSSTKPSSSSSSGPKFSSGSSSSTKPSSSNPSDSGKYSSTPSPSRSNWQPKPIRPSANIPPKFDAQKEYQSHFDRHKYYKPYSHYNSLPKIDVGGGISPIFWYMMGEWSADRRAEWLYNHQSTIKPEYYDEAIKDKEVAALIEKKRAEKAAINSKYVDPEFSNQDCLVYGKNYNKPLSATEVATINRSIFVVGILVVLILTSFILWLVFSIEKPASSK